MRRLLPWPHPHRADVLAALALAARLREPLDRGLTRLAEGDPLLRPWAVRLGPDLAAGAPLGATLLRHGLLVRDEARRLDADPDQATAIDRLGRDGLAPLRGLLLVRWFPVALVAAMLAPVALLQLCGVTGAFEQIFHELNIRLPALTVAMLDRSLTGLLLPLVGAGAVWLLLAVLASARGLRHLRRLCWVEVHRQHALLQLVEAARDGDDAPVVLPRWVSWLSVLRLWAWRQGRPAWDRDWRAYRILTRWRAMGGGWHAAARAATAAGLLQDLGMLPPGGDRAAIDRLREEIRVRLAYALEPARVEAQALITVAIACGLAVAVLAMFLPLVSIVMQLNGSG